MRRPNISEMGARNIGPMPKPRTNRAVGKLGVYVSVSPNSTAMALPVTASITEAMGESVAWILMRMTFFHFFRGFQFRGFSVSSGPSHFCRTLEKLRSMYMLMRRTYHGMAFAGRRFNAVDYSLLGLGKPHVVGAVESKLTSVEIC